MIINRRNVSILSGPIGKNMLTFVIPIFLSNILSFMFNALDLVVVGQFCGSHAIAAVGSTSRIVNLSICLFVGFAEGFGVVLSHAIGEGDNQKISRAINTAIPFAIILGIILTVFGLCTSKWMLGLINTPDDIIDDANLYLKIYFYGVTLCLLMNFVFNALRMAGDTKTPTVCLAIGGLLNVGFNILFVKAFGMTVDGVAFGTVISEGTSAVLGIIALMKRKDAVRFDFKKMCLDKNIIKLTTNFGVPTGLQTGMFSISTIILTSAINTLGTTVITANSAAINIDEIFLNSVATAYSSATSAFTAQNYAARNYDRVKKTLKSASVVVIAVLIFIGFIINIFSKNLLSVYITDSVAAIKIGQLKMRISGLLYFMTAFASLLTAAMRGLGDAKRPLYASIVTNCIFKVVWVYTIFRIPGFNTYLCLIISYPVSWALTIAANLIMLRHDWKKMDKEAEKRLAATVLAD